MRRLNLIWTVTAALVVATGVPEGFAEDSEAKQAPVDFRRDIWPIFVQNCHDCHGGDAREGGLRLDLKASALAGGDSGQVIVPGKPDESLLIQYVSGEGDTVMPPETEGLPDNEVAVLRRWIAEGADWPAAADAQGPGSEHWAFQPLARTKPPTWPGGPEHPIDAFVQARLREAGIEPSPEADRTMLIKRLNYDLLGLPPQPEAVDRFVNDSSPQAYKKLVDELLASPHFGERWGRHWLDMARYADSDGYEKDNPRYNAWKYRDWVIRAINDDLPFDQFSIEQLAGDLLPSATPAQLVATGFNRQTLTNTEGGTDPEQFRVEAVFDRVETLGTVWLGLTVGCARCHTHKYDPITQREYYQLFAFFNNGDEASIPVATSDEAMQEYVAARAEFDARMAEKRRPLYERRAALAPQLPEWEAQQQAALAEKRGQPATRHDLEFAALSSNGGATLERQADGSVLVSGTSPDADTYVLECEVPVAELTALQLDVLNHDSLPGKGPGRADNGNFVLTEFVAEIYDPSLTEPVPLTFSQVRADHAQKGFQASEAVDGREDSGGWAIDPQTGQDHWALFYLSDESRARLADLGSPIRLTLRLVQRHTGQPRHTLGHFRLRGMTGFDEYNLGVPENIRTILSVPRDQRDPAQADELLEYFAGLDETYRTLKAAVDEFQKQAPFKPEMAVPVIQERRENRRVTQVLKRGDFLDPLGEVQPGTLSVLPPLESRAESGPDRLDLARWLFASGNPLPARVAVNHVWKHLFGFGLVRTVNDFGTRGEPPTHPELLDWLATEFARLGWSRKALIKTIVMSYTYRQTSRHRPELAEVDPENRLLHRQNRFRVEAEIIRDLHLAASGLLSRQIGGPSVFPPLPPGIAELSYAGNFRWGVSEWNSRPDRPGSVPPEKDIYRRGMYTFFKRTAPHPNLTTFDCPDANLTNVQRSVSNTPLQALVTLNNDVFVDAARSMMRRVLREVNTNDAERIAHMFRLCVARHPTEEERNAFLDLLTAAREYYAGHEEEAVAFAGAELPADTPPMDAAAWTATARIVMNLDEFITRE